MPRIGAAAAFIRPRSIRPLPEPHALLERLPLRGALAHQLRRGRRQLQDHAISSSSSSAMSRRTAVSPPCPCIHRGPPTLGDAMTDPNTLASHSDHASFSLPRDSIAGTSQPASIRKASSRPWAISMRLESRGSPLYLPSLLHAAAQCLLRNASVFSLNSATCSYIGACEHVSKIVNSDAVIPLFKRSVNRVDQKPLDVRLRCLTERRGQVTGEHRERSEGDGRGGRPGAVVLMTAWGRARSGRFRRARPTPIQADAEQVFSRASPTLFWACLGRDGADSRTIFGHRPYLGPRLHTRTKEVRGRRGRRHTPTTTVMSISKPRRGSSIGPSTFSSGR